MRTPWIALAISLSLGAAGPALALPPHTSPPSNPLPPQPPAAASAICSGHGLPAGPICTCLPGWGGASCQSPAPPACNGHGVQIQGRCVCSTYWMGPYCEAAGLSITGGVVRP